MPFNYQETERAPHAGVLLVILLIASLLLTVVYDREGQSGPLHSLQGVAQSIATPFASAGNSVSQSAQNLSVAASDQLADADTLSALEEQNRELRNLVSQLEEYRQEAQRLEGLVSIRDIYTIEGATARVVGRSGEAYSQTITLDAGTNDGVDVGQTVMGSNGVVGQVISVAPASCTVRLLTDPQSGCAVLLQSSRAEGVIRGSLDGLLYLENVDVNVDVQVGDVVVTSGLGGSYVSGLLVGTVVRIDNSQGSSARRIVVSPNEGTSNLTEVIIVKSAIDPAVTAAKEAEERAAAEKAAKEQQELEDLMSGNTSDSYDYSDTYDYSYDYSYDGEGE